MHPRHSSSHVWEFHTAPNPIADPALANINPILETIVINFHNKPSFIYKYFKALSVVVSLSAINSTLY